MQSLEIFEHMIKVEKDILITNVIIILNIHAAKLLRSTSTLFFAKSTGQEFQ